MTQASTGYAVGTVPNPHQVSMLTTRCYARPVPILVAIRSIAELASVTEQVTAAMIGKCYPQRDVFAVRLGLEEALVNAFKHGHQGVTNKEVRVRYKVTDEEVVVEVEDQGPGFNPTSVPDPTAEENLGRTGGRGLLLMRHYLTGVRYHGRGNCVTLLKRRTEM